jgi:intein/homing endonuclease
MRNVEVLSYNFESKQSEYRKVTAAAMTNPKSKVLRITDTETGKQLICTKEHQVWTDNRGYVEAGKLLSTDKLRIL